MKQILLFLVILLTINHISFAQNRRVARGAEPGELYFTGLWYGASEPSTLRYGVYRLTENGKKLTIQYDADYYANPEQVMQPTYILADATPGVVYNKSVYYKNSYSYTQLWVSFDYGENWIFREENIGSHNYYSANFRGLIYRGWGGVFKSTDYGQSFYIEHNGGACHDCDMGLNEQELFSVGNRMLFHTLDFFRNYTTINIDTSFMYGQIMGIFPDVYRGGKEGEVYVMSPFLGAFIKLSFSDDFGQTFRHVYTCEGDECIILTDGGFKKQITFMTDREPGVFYAIWYNRVEDENPLGFHNKICIAYYRDYGETLEAYFCHDLTKDYEYEEVICDNITFLETNVVNGSSIQLQWSNLVDTSFIRGYHIYRDNTRVTNELRTNTTYLDENLPVGSYEYYIRTFYKEGCVSDSSNIVRESVELGVKRVKELEEVMVYPNPTTGELTIDNCQLSIDKVEIFDIYGRILSSHHLITSSLPHQIDISHLHSGVYFLKIETEKSIITKKIIKY